MDCRNVGQVMLNAEGWALDATGRHATQVELVVDGRHVATTATVHRRADVPKVHAHAQGPCCGHIFRIPADAAAPPESIVVNIVGPSGTSAMGGRPSWFAPDTLQKTRTDLPRRDVPRASREPGESPHHHRPRLRVPLARGPLTGAARLRPAGLP